MKWKYLMAQIGQIERPFKITLLYSNCGAREGGVLAVSSLQLRNCFHGMLLYSQVWNNKMQSEKRATSSPKLMSVIRELVRWDLNESWVSSGVSGSAYLCTYAHICVWFTCAHTFMCSKGRVEAQNYRAGLSDPLLFIFALLDLCMRKQQRSASSNKDGKKSLPGLFWHLIFFFLK